MLCLCCGRGEAAEGLIIARAAGRIKTLKMFASALHPSFNLKTFAHSEK
jgi:hypothetical protein